MPADAGANRRAVADVAREPGRGSGGLVGGGGNRCRSVRGLAGSHSSGLQGGMDGAPTEKECARDTRKVARERFPVNIFTLDRSNSAPRVAGATRGALFAFVAACPFGRLRSSCQSDLRKHVKELCKKGRSRPMFFAKQSSALQESFWAASAMFFRRAKLSLEGALSEPSRWKACVRSSMRVCYSGSSVGRVRANFGPMCANC